MGERIEVSDGERPLRLARDKRLFDPNVQLLHPGLKPRSSRAASIGGFSISGICNKSP